MLTQLPEGVFTITGLKAIKVKGNELRVEALNDKDEWTIEEVKAAVAAGGNSSSSTTTTTATTAEPKPTEEAKGEDEKKAESDNSGSEGSD